MKTAWFKKSVFFYIVVFVLWAVYLLVTFQDHRYEENPVPSAGLEQSHGG